MTWACACRTRCTDCGTPTCLERTPASLCEPCGQPTCGECDHECEAECGVAGCIKLHGHEANHARIENGRSVSWYDHADGAA